MLIYVARYSLVILMIKDKIEHETIDTITIISIKSSEFSCVDCVNVVAPSFSSFSESVKLFTMIPRVSPIISSFSDSLELFSGFGHISVGPSDVIPLVVSDVHPLRKLIYLFVISFEILLSELVALHLPEMHDESHKHITICNDNYKFVAYSHSIFA